MSDKINILCVEDNAFVTDYISASLDRERYKVSIIKDGQKALDFLLTTPDAPDIVLLDYILPSLDGIQILKALKAHQKVYPVIFLTAVETIETVVEAMKEGAIDYLAKSRYLSTELDIKIEKAYAAYQEYLKKEYYEKQLSMLSLAVEQSPNCIVITDKEGNIKYVNDKFTKYTGYTFEEAIGKNPRILKTDNYAPGFFENLWKTISLGNTWKGELKNRKKNGELYYEKAIIAPIKDKQGHIESYMAIKEDVTELKKTEQALKQKTEEINNFFTVAVDLLSIMDSSTGKFIRVNNAWENTIGYTVNEITGKSYIDFIHPDDKKITEEANQKLNEKGRLLNFVNRYRCKDGTYKFIEWSSINNNNGTFYSSARDITERILNERALKESEDRFRSIFEMANAGIFFANKTGQFMMANKAFLDMVEYNSDEIIGMDFTELTFEDDQVAENELLKNLVFNEIDQYRIEKRYVTRSNKIVWADLAVTVINDADRNPVSYVGVIQNISQRKEFEQQLKQIITTKDKFFSIISHDLRNQFASILGFADFIKGSISKFNDTHCNKLIDLLFISSTHALEMLEDLLKWSRSQINGIELKKEIINLRELTEHLLLTLNNQANLKNIEIVTNIGTANHLNADRQMISTVLRNLINNALKFTPAGGRVVISAKTMNGNDTISVKDNGVGMSPEVINKLFRIDAKHSTPGTEKEMGTGLGLILCKEFVDKHGGDIIVKSDPGKGSEFIISIPVT